jgi:ABC-2 type transport system permease protein
LKALRELYLANLTEFLGNRRVLFLTIGFPVVFIIIFGLVFTNQDKVDARIGIANEDDGEIGIQLTKAFEALPKGDPDRAASHNKDEEDKNPLSACEFVRGERESLKEDLRRGRLDAVITIPSDASSAALVGDPASLILTIDPARQLLSPILQGIINQVLEKVNAKITNQPKLFDLKTETASAREVRTIDYLLPGILAMSIMQLGVLATAQPLVGLRVQGVLKRLHATPLPRWTLLVAYIALRLTIALSQTALIVLIGRFAFKVAMVGSWWAFSGWVMLGTTAFISIGFFMAAIGKNEESVTAMGNIVNLPMILLAGIFFPVNHLPPYLNPLIGIVPLNYLADALRQTMVDALPMHSPMTNAVALTLWIIVMTILAIRFFRWEESR